MKQFLSFFAGLMLLSIIPTQVFAQSGFEVKGVVTDATGPVIGATIMERGTSNGTSTGLDGDFSLRVSGPDAIVEVSCIGYKSASYVASSMPATITIEEDSMFLDDVVVIGYGTAKKEDLTGSVAAIKPDEMSKGITNNASDMLVGKIAGVDVQTAGGSPGAGAQIRIRGGGLSVCIQ